MDSTGFNIMKKNEIYLSMIKDAVVQSRNVSTLPFLKKASDKSVYFDSELVHNLFSTLHEEEIVEHDIFFLNNQAKWYLENCSEEKSPLFLENKKRIEELLSLVPEDRKLEVLLLK
jgi:hypothetical protein